MATIKFTYRTPDAAGRRPVETAATAAAAAAAASEASAAGDELKPVKVDRWWRESSYDLWHGLEVREDAPDTIPAEWLDELDLP